MDLVDRMYDLKALYTDAGVHTRQDLITHHPENHIVIIHDANGTYLFQLLIFLVHIVINLFYTVGYRTTLFGFLNWWLIVSLQVHSSFVGHSGDVYQRVILFWSLFMPISECWSIDALIKKYYDVKLTEMYKRSGKVEEADVNQSKNHWVTSAATLGCYVHVFACYVSSYYHKTGEQWHDGTAVKIALNLKYFQMPLAYVLLMLPDAFLKLSCAATLFWEHNGWLFLMSPVFSEYSKLFGVFGFLAMHFAFGGALRVGLFAITPCSFFPIFLPPIFWDWIFSFWRNRKQTDLIIGYNINSSFSKILAIFFSDFMLIPGSKLISFENNKKSYNWLYLKGPKTEKYDIEALLFIADESPLLFLFSKFINSAQSLKDSLDSLLLTLSQNFEIDKVENELKMDTRTYETKNLFLKHKYVWKTSAYMTLQIFLFYLCVLIVSWNLSNIGTASFIGGDVGRAVMLVTKMDQSWHMFSPHPPISSWWYVIDAELVNYEKVELFQNGALHTFKYNKEVDWSMQNIRAGVGGHRWYKYFENGYNGASRDHLRLSFGRYVCREFNSRYNGGEQVYTFKVYFYFSDYHVSNNSRTPGPSGGQELWSHVCFDVRPAGFEPPYVAPEIGKEIVEQPKEDYEPFLEKYLQEEGKKQLVNENDSLHPQLVNDEAISH
jgi:hypothetical protein